MIDPSSRAPDSSLSRRIRRMVTLDPGATALFFGGLTFPWSFYSDAVADLETLLAAHPAARRVGIVLRNRPEALVEAVEILIARPDSVRAVLLRGGYTDEASIGGFLDEDLTARRAR